MIQSFPITFESLCIAIYKQLILYYVYIEF
jgi:hypothetical protein